jgi:hypothetical protein
MAQTSSRILLRSPRIAQRVFGLDSPGQLVRSVPRAKFMFKVEFTPSAAANEMINYAPLNSSTDIRSIAFKVKSIDKPRVSFKTVDLNHYNKNKLAYTKVDYNEAQLRIYDTVDNSMLTLWVNYFTYYFGDSRGTKTETDYKQSSVAAKYIDGSGWGFRPISENVQFFDSIDVTAFYGQTMTTFRYMNPRIVSIDWQQKDYSMSDLEELTIGFKYEAIQYEKFGEPATDFDTGWQSNDTIDYPTSGVSTPAAFQPRIFGNQTATFNQSQVSAPINDPSNIVGSLPYNTSAIAPGATIPNSLLNSNMLQPNNLVAGLAMAMNYIPNGIQGINNFPFTTLLSLGGIKGIGGLSNLLGSAIGTQLGNLGGVISNFGSGISGLFNSAQISNIFQAGIPQPTGYMSSVTSSALPDITPNADTGVTSQANPEAVAGKATSPAADLSTSDIGVGVSGQGSSAQAPTDTSFALANGEQQGSSTNVETQLAINETGDQAPPVTSADYGAAQDPPSPPIDNTPAEVQLADPQNNSLFNA